MIAPQLFVPEVTNVFWKYHKFQTMTAEECTETLEQTLALPDELLDGRGLYREAFALACRLGRPAYDMFYLVSARRENAMLATADKQLGKLAAEQGIRCV